MTGIIVLFVFLGILLLLILAGLLFSRQQGALTTIEDDEENRRSFATFADLKLPSRALAERLFAPEDWEFIKRELPEGLKSLGSERRQLAALWLDETTERMQRIHRFHRLLIRESESVSVGEELKIAADYAGFVLLVAITRGVIYLLGPFQAHMSIKRLCASATRISVSLDKLLATFEYSRVGDIREMWARQSAT